MRARYQILAIVLASLLQGYVVNAQDELLINVPKSNSQVQPQHAISLQKGFLEHKRDFAQSRADAALELDAIDKLALIKGRSSKEYLFASISYKLRQGGKIRSQGLNDIEKLCSISNSSYECVQAKALAAITDPLMRVKLQSFVMHENNADYENAVKDLDELFPNAPVVEHDLRLRYYTMMGNIDGREMEASAGLSKMLSEIPYENALKLKIKYLANKLLALGLANNAIKRIDDPRYVKAAQNDLRKALALDPSSDKASYWQEMLSSSIYYRTVDVADIHLAKAPRLAITYYKKAIASDPNSPYAYVGLCRAYAALKDERNFSIYAKKALHSSLNESVSEQKRIRRVIKSLEGDFYVARAQRAKDKGNLTRARELYRRSLQVTRNDPWLYYDLASLELEAGAKEEAVAVMESAPFYLKHSSEYAHAYALILDKCGQEEEALNAIKPYITKDKSIKRTYDRIDSGVRLDKAGSLVAAGKYDEALALIDKLNSARALALKSDIMQGLGNRTLAINYAEQSLALDPIPSYIRLGLCKLYYEDLQTKSALSCVSELKNSLNTLSLDEKRSLGQLYAALGDKDTALDIFRQALNDKDEVYANASLQEESLTNTQPHYQSETDPPWTVLRAYSLNDASFLHRYRSFAFNSPLSSAVSPNNELSSSHEATMLDDKELTADKESLRTSAWIRSETASLLAVDKESAQEGAWQLRQALSELDGRDYSDDVTYTTALRTPDENEDWLHRSVRVRGDEAYLYNSVIIEDGINFIRDSGHPGYSDNKGYINVLKISFPLFKGRAAFQTDRVFMDPGSLSGGRYEDMFGTIFAEGTNDTASRKRSTNTFALAYAQDNFKFDLGTAPDIDNGGRGITFVGGASMDFDFGDLSLTPYIYRRAKDNSVLSYFGERDSGTGIRYGAVKKNGIGLSGSYYLGPQDGLWFDSSFEILKGSNVKTNHDLTMMGGYYHHLIDEPNERLTLAPSVMFMSYAHDLSGYTLGQGGYYSPQLYLSSSLTLRYMRRHEDYSYLIEGSGSLAFSHKKSEARYPFNDLVPQSVVDRNASSSADSSISFGWGIRAALERRISSRLVVGASTGYSKSDDYSPFNFLLYFRYYCTDYAGDLYMPPAGPVPYTKW